MDDIVQQTFMQALSGLPYPVSQPPGDASAETWITYQPVRGAAKAASNGPTRIRHLVQIHSFSHSEDDAHRTAFFAAIAALEAAGIRVWSWGPDDYEQDTQIHHIAATVTWWQREGSGATAKPRDPLDDN